MRKRKIWGLMSVIAVFLYFALGFTANSSPQADYYQMPECPIPGSGQRVLVFTPHPDDESIAVGGYIYNARQAGAKVKIVLVTDGNLHGLKEQRYQEFNAATGQLQVSTDDTYFWGYPDSHLAAHFSALESQVEEEIESYRPNYVIYPHPKDQHPDHAALGQAVEQALASESAAGRDIGAFAYLVHFKYYPEPQLLPGHQFLMPPLAFTKQDGVWYKVPLSAPAEQTKRQALHQYRTQLRNPFLQPLFIGLMRHNELLVSRPISP